jgi:hypothetical protein
MFFFSHLWQQCHDLGILDSKTNFSRKKVKKYMCLEFMAVRIGRIRIRMPWMPIPIQIWQNDADPTLCGSATLLKNIEV